jgi:hypothetical protein
VPKTNEQIDIEPPRPKSFKLSLSEDWTTGEEAGREARLTGLESVPR